MPRSNPGANLGMQRTAHPPANFVADALHALTRSSSSRLLAGWCLSKKAKSAERERTRNVLHSGMPVLRTPTRLERRFKSRTVKRMDVLAWSAHS